MFQTERSKRLKDDLRKWTVLKSKSVKSKSLDSALSVLKSTSRTVQFHPLEPSTLDLTLFLHTYILFLGIEPKYDFKLFLKQVSLNYEKRVFIVSHRSALPSIKCWIHLIKLEDIFKEHLWYFQDCN